MNERIEKKLNQIEKIEKKLNKYGALLTNEQKELALKLRWKERMEYCGRDYDLERNMEGYDRAYNELTVAKEQLEKIKKQIEKKEAKEATLNNMPEALVEFQKRMEETWNKYDKAEREWLKEQYEMIQAKYPKNSLQGYKEFIKEYKYSGYDTMHKTDDEIEQENKKAAESLILNLFERVVEKVGQITDAKELCVTSGNGGLAVVNGVVFGEKGKAVVESIGAGGYNIQRYHVRTLVK